MTPVDGTLKLHWGTCGSSATIYLDFYINSNYQNIVTHNTSISSCAFRNDYFTVPAQPINDAINTSGGQIQARVRVYDGCPAGYGCSHMSDPCASARLTYHYLPDANFSADITSTCTGGLVTFTNESTGPIDTLLSDFGAGANPPADTGNGPHEGTYATSGFKTITLLVT